MTLRDSLFAAGVLLALGGWALEPGDPAPALDGVTYLRGTAPDLTAQWTLVEFWATWCGACKRSIPGLTELQKRHGAKLAVVGLSDEAEAVVRPFVEAQGEAMAYSVGLVSQETRGRYMAGRSGIPCAFLVSPQKQVAWVGHPATVGPVLQQALDGRLDVERARRVEPLVKALTDALRSRNPALAAQAADALLAEEPAHLDGLRVRLALARQARDAAAARAAFARVDPAAVTPADAEAVAHILLGEADLAFCFVDLVSPLVARVSAAAPEAPSTLVLQARYAYALGRIEEAIACQEKAAAAEPGAMAVLEYYRKIRELRDTPRPADGK